VRTSWTKPIIFDIRGSEPKRANCRNVLTNARIEIGEGQKVDCGCVFIDSLTKLLERPQALAAG